jgi:hypothetical protein
VTLESASRGNPLNVEIPGTEQHGLITVLDDTEPEMIPGTVREDPLLPPEDVQEHEKTAEELDAELEATFAEAAAYTGTDHMPETDDTDSADDDEPKPPPPPHGGNGRRPQSHRRLHTDGKSRDRIPLTPIDKDTMDIPI